MKITGLRMLFGLLMPVVLVSAAFGQTEQRDLRPRNCAIQGRVTISGQPAANALVTVTEVAQTRRAPATILLAADGSLARTVYRTRTDADGLYQFTGLAAATYSVGVSSRALVAAESNPNRDPNLPLTLDEGESRDKVDFALVRGGVITGQVADSESRPVIAHSVNLFRVEAGGRTEPVYGSGNSRQVKTDDRGIYRIYGLRSGRYLISVNGGGIHAGNGEKHRRTFHPNASSESGAGIIELKAGEEKTDIDVRLVLSGKRYEALGRLVDADTGKPLPNIHLSCAKVAKLNDNQEDEGGDSTVTDGQGNFHLSGLSSGRYSVRLGSESGNDFYVEDVFFEIADDNLNGIEVRAVAGGVLSGVAVVEGASKISLTEIRLLFLIQKEGTSSLRGSIPMISINAEGTFRVGGLLPGVVRLQVFDFRNSGLQLLRMERGGGEIKGDLAIGGGEKITDLRLVFGQGSGVIRGQVRVIGEALPNGWVLFAFARRLGAVGGLGTGSVMVDEKGRFVITDLLGGEYELTVQARPPRAATGNPLQPIAASQKVIVTNGAEAQVTVNFDTTPKPGGDKQ